MGRERRKKGIGKEKKEKMSEDEETRGRGIRGRE